MKLLFVCTHNRCRSIICEAICRHLYAGQLEAHSAGSQPAGEVHPLSLKYLAEYGVPTAGLRSKSWDEFTALEPDLVITVCDSAAAEVCPVWMGNSERLHWSLKDPSKLELPEEDMRQAFFELMRDIENRLFDLYNRTPQ